MPFLYIFQNGEKFGAENDMWEECVCVFDVLRVLRKGQSHNNSIFLTNLTTPLMEPQIGYGRKKALLENPFQMECGSSMWI